LAVATLLGRALAEQRASSTVDLAANAGAAAAQFVLSGAYGIDVVQQLPA
jgi:hypothetical protein